MRISDWSSDVCSSDLMGVSYVTLTGEYVFSKLPYPLLSLHLGNQTPFFAHVTYNLMDYGEFVSDRYAALHYSHHFEGFLLNRIDRKSVVEGKRVSVRVVNGGRRIIKKKKNKKK